jgi:hypothetical protein
MVAAGLTARPEGTIRNAVSLCWASVITYTKLSGLEAVGLPMNWIVPSVWLLGIGWCFATPLAVGVLAGVWLDGRTGKAPLFVILGTLVGLAVGIYGSVRMLLRFLEETSRNEGTPRH